MELSNLANLVALYLSQNQLSGCIPEGLRDVTDNDLEDLDLPFCDVLLSGLTISPGSTTPPFNPYHTDYAVVVGQSQVTVTPTTDHNSTLHFLDQNRVEVADADGSLDGYQVDLGLGVTTISISVISQDGRATLTYTNSGKPGDPAGGSSCKRHHAGTRVPKRFLDRAPGNRGRQHHLIRPAPHRKPRPGQGRRQLVFGGRCLDRRPTKLHHHRVNRQHTVRRASAGGQCRGLRTLVQSGE